MRSLLLGLFAGGLIVACTTSTSPPDILITSLTDSEQVALCNDFLDRYCDAGTLDPVFCADDCVNNINTCTVAMTNGDIDTECVGVLDGEVIDCSDFGPNDPECDVGAGGCMIDAVSAACGL